MLCMTLLDSPLAEAWERVCAAHAASAPLADNRAQLLAFELATWGAPTMQEGGGGGARGGRLVPLATKAASLPSRAAPALRPVSAAGEPVRYLTDEQKRALNAKYGRIAAPNP